MPLYVYYYYFFKQGLILSENVLSILIKDEKVLGPNFGWQHVINSLSPCAEDITVANDKEIDTQRFLFYLMSLKDMSEKLNQHRQ